MARQRGGGRHERRRSAPRTEDHGAGALPRRRVLLLGCGLLGSLAPGLGGCSSLRPGERRAPRAFTPDEQAVADAIAAAVRLRAAAAALATSTPDLAQPARRIAGEHTEHLRALGAPDRVIAQSAPPTASGAEPSAAAAPGPTIAPGPPGPAALRDAEWAAAADAATDAATAVAPLAALLARIAAARAVHADAIAAAAAIKPPPARLPASPPPPVAPTDTAAATELSGSAQEALGALLAGAHGAVFAYPLVVARSSPAQHAEAVTAWRQHVAERDSLERLLVAATVEPVAAAPAYDVGRTPRTPAEAAALATRVEVGLCRLAVPAVAATTGPARELSTAQLVASARRAALWSGRSTALPGS